MPANLAPRKGVVIDDSDLMGHLHDYALVLGKSLGEVIREQAGLFCMDLVRYTRPFKSPGQGLENTAKKAGEENVRKGVFKIFSPIERATPQQIASIGRHDVFKMWVKSGQNKDQQKGIKAWTRFQARYAGGKPIQYIDSGDTSAMERIHYRHRKYSGKGGLQQYAIKAKQPFAFVKNEKVIEKYQKLHQKNVGSFKSTYWYAAQKIRAKSVKAPAWLRQQRGMKFAIGIDKIQQAMKPEAEVGNLIGLRAMPKSLMRAALSRRAYAMRVNMIRELNRQKVPLWLASARGQTVNTSRFF